MFDVKDSKPTGSNVVPVDLAGTIYFDFESADAWRLFVLLATAEQEGASLDLRWVGFPPEGPGESAQMSPSIRALAAHAAVVEPQRQRRVREALFTLRHRHGDSFADDLTYRAAAKVAGLDGDVLLGAISDVGHRTLIEHHATAIDVGVDAVPSVVGEGPPLHVRTTPAVLLGQARPRIRLIAQMLGDDGMWGLGKP